MPEPRFRRLLIPAVIAGATAALLASVAASQVVGATGASGCLPGSATLVPVLAMNAGGPQVTAGGRTWRADFGATGGKTWTNPYSVDIGSTKSDILYRSERAGTFSYALPVPAAGNYLVRLHMAEIYWGAPGGAAATTTRIQTVNLEGRSPELVRFPVAKEAGGPMRAVVRGFETRVSDGWLNIAASATAGDASLAAVEVARIVPCGARASSPPTVPSVAVPSATPTTTAPAPTASTTSPTSWPAAAFRRKATVTNGVLTPGWGTATRPDAGGSELLKVAQDHTYHEVGGWRAGSHFSRLVRDLPARDNHYIDATSPAGRFIMRSKFWLPADFYTRHESYLRFFNIDNWPSRMSGSGQMVGADDEDEWRVYFGIESVFYKTPKFGVHHQNNEEMTLWTPANSNAHRLPTGMNEVIADFTPNTPGKADGAWKLTINGVVVGQATGVRTMPTTLAHSERKVTTMFSGIDGAYAQSTKRLGVRIYETELIEP